MSTTIIYFFHLMLMLSASFSDITFTSAPVSISTLMGASLISTDVWKSLFETRLILFDLHRFFPLMSAG